MNERTGIGSSQRATMTAEEVADAWDCSTGLVYRMVREGTCPVEPIRLGARKLVWPRASVERSLGLSGAVLGESAGPIGCPGVNGYVAPEFGPRRVDLRCRRTSPEQVTRERENRIPRRQA